MDGRTNGHRGRIGIAERRIVAAACLATLLTGACPASVLACGGCTDRQIALTLPWVPATLPLIWAWLLALVVGRLVTWIARRAEPRALVSWWTIISFTMLSTVGVILLSILFQGSGLLPALVIGVVWAGFLVVCVLLGISGGLSRRSGWAGVAAWAIDLAFLAIAGVTIVVVSDKCNTPEYHIRRLDYHVSATYSVSMPKIVDFGERSIEPLIEAGNQCLRSEHLRDDSLASLYLQRKLFGIAFCLGEIGGPEAEAWLAHAMQREIDVKGVQTRDWELAVCYAYAKCGRERAVDALIRLHSKLTSDDSRPARPAVDLALLLTASHRGIAFVLDHMAELFDAEQDDRQAAHAAAAALVFGEDPTVFASLPVYRHILLLGPPRVPDSSPQDFSNEFYWTEANQDLQRPMPEIRAAWDRDREKILERWKRVLVD